MPTRSAGTLQHQNCPREDPELLPKQVPKNARDRGGSLYLSPPPFTPTGTRPWFPDDPLSLMKLKGLLKKVCEGAEVEGNFTNHSLRATLLFDAGVPELIIQEREREQLGQKSLDALCTYERDNTKTGTESGTDTFQSTMIL